jgi:hypothetical protein
VPASRAHHCERVLIAVITLTADRR